MKNKNEKAQEENVVVEAEVVPQKLSIPELARQLEEGAINPATRSKRELRGVALYFRSLKYETDDIATILKITRRSVERYIKKIKQENNSLIGLSFQKKLMTDMMKRWWSRDNRLLRLSYAPDMPSHKKASILFMRHKIDMNMVALFERLGYLIKYADGSEAADFRNKMDYFKGVFSQFTDEQHKLLSKNTEVGYEEYMGNPKYHENYKKMMTKFLEENKKRLKESYDKDPLRLLDDKTITTCVADICNNIIFKKPTEMTVS